MLNGHGAQAYPWLAFSAFMQVRSLTLASYYRHYRRHYWREAISAG